MYHLLKLWTLGSKNLSIQEIANAIQLSTKQTARNLKKYEELGYLTYIPGKGRGNKSVIRWHQDINDIVKNNIHNERFRMEIFKRLDVDELTDHVSRNLFEAIFSEVKGSNYALKIPIYSEEIMKNPIHVADTESAWILMHLNCRLVSEDGKGEMAYHWTQRDEGFVFYLRPNLYWHDGTPITTEQIVDSLNKSFLLTKYGYFQRKLNRFSCLEDKLIIDYEGALEELLLLFAQVEFSIYQEEKYSGAYQLNQSIKDQYVLTPNLYYFMSKPIISKIILQTIPSELTRKITWSEDDSWQQQWEYGGTFYLYYKQDRKQETLDFFRHFAQRVSQLDESKKAVEYIHHYFAQLNEHVKVGYFVNKQKFVDLLREMNQEYLQITHFNFKERTTLEHLKEYDYIIMPLNETENLQIEDELRAIFPNRLALYQSYRKMYYPRNFVRRGIDLFGYPNLKESFVVKDMR